MRVRLHIHLSGVILCLVCACLFPFPCGVGLIAPPTGFGFRRRGTLVFSPLFSGLLGRFRGCHGFGSLCQSDGAGVRACTCASFSTPSPQVRISYLPFHLLCVAPGITWQSQSCGLSPTRRGRIFTRSMILSDLAHRGTPPLATSRIGYLPGCGRVHYQGPSQPAHVLALACAAAAVQLHPLHLRNRSLSLGR